MTNRKTSYIPPISTGVTGVEKNDCVVRAIANAMEISYREAYEIVAPFGRRPNSGVYPTVVARIMKSIGAKCIGIFGTTLVVDTWKKHHPEAPHYQGITVERALRFCKQGNFIFNVRGHSFAVIDGEIIDNGYNRANAYVSVIYGVKDET